MEEWQNDPLCKHLLTKVKSEEMAEIIQKNPFIDYDDDGDSDGDSGSQVVSFVDDTKVTTSRFLTANFGHEFGIGNSYFEYRGTLTRISSSAKKDRVKGFMIGTMAYI